MIKLKFVVWVDDGEGWRIYGSYSTEEEALEKAESFDYAYVDYEDS